MAATTVLNYLPRKSPVHALTGATKLAFFLLFTFASMVTYDTRVLVVLMVFSFAAFRLSRIRIREVRFMLVFMLVFLLLNNFFIYLFDPDQGSKIYGTRHVLLHIAGRYDVTSEQLFYMLNISLKYFVALPVAILFISATNPSEFAASLNKIGVPYRIGYAVSIALRYIPDHQRDYHNTSQAQQARGVELGKKEKLIKRLKNSVTILLPLIMSSGQGGCDFQRDGAARVRQAQKAHLVCGTSLPKGRLDRPGAGRGAAGHEPHRDLLGRKPVL